jgi:hypothetical protein
MSYALSISSLNILTDSADQKTEECGCDVARDLCAPSFVFSIEGQVGFRTALEHLSSCRTRECGGLKVKLHDSMKNKLNWLFKEECLLGCVHVQPLLYGSRKASMQKKDFSAIAHHLSRCPKESCAQLRRSVLLTIRDDLRAQPAS